MKLNTLRPGDITVRPAKKDEGPDGSIVLVLPTLEGETVRLVIENNDLSIRVLSDAFSRGGRMLRSVANALRRGNPETAAQIWRHVEALNPTLGPMRYNPPESE